MVPSDFLAVNEYSDLALAETNARTLPVAANGATRSALADATAPIKTTRSMEISTQFLEILEIAVSRSVRGCARARCAPDGTRADLSLLYIARISSTN